MAEFWAALAALPPAAWLRQSALAYLLVNAAHIASLGVLVGAIGSLDVRLLGGFRAVPVAAVGPFLSRMAAGGLAAAVVTGLWLFSVNPAEYAANPAFLAKLGLVVAAVGNALWLHARAGWGRALAGAAVPGAVRAHAAFSLGLWLAVVVAGRWIGFA